MATDIITSLLAIEQELTLWFFSAQPVDDDDRASMTKVLALRDRLFQKVNKITEARVLIAAAGLTGPTAALNAQSDKIKATAKDISTAEDVISIVTTVIGIAATIMTAVGI
jgi:hypothetical protein